MGAQGSQGRQLRVVRGSGSRARTRDPKREFERLYRESYEVVYNFVRYRMAGDADAEDVVAEAYLRAARSFGSYDPTRARFSTWVSTIAMNCMRDHWRRSRPVVSLDEVGEGHLAEPDAAGEVVDRDQVDRLLSVLTAQEREIVIMRYRDGLRNVDIATELSMNASTVATRLAAALAKMRSALP